MPLFTYFCQDCQTDSEILIRAKDAPVCPHCESKKLLKQLSAFATVGEAARAMEGCGAPSCCRLDGGSCMN